ncbi:hypothetical protein [Burkholderia ubonensis]|uniref:hypothetical protein n=1 Tax=Burkholderia ubonensis TaxID=101571 RepID=UPI000754167F|nr:hypothetical protein [Burkholderia ubonensis]KVP16936.1 hypothetical protein WJ84_01290 [Burkholderia ubonensis]
MWPFILILAIVPMIFFWSDSVRDLFPQLEHYLPEKSSTALMPKQEQPNLPPELKAGAEPGRWYISQTDKGYVAWVMSADGQYRTAVGCHAGAPATLQVTHLTGATMPNGLHLNYQYGKLPLTKGYYTGAELINGLAQFKDVYLQNEATEVLAQFTVPTAESNAVARAVEGACAAPGTTVSQ